MGHGDDGQGETCVVVGARQKAKEIETANATIVFKVQHHPLVQIFLLPCVNEVVPIGCNPTPH